MRLIASVPQTAVEDEPAAFRGAPPRPGPAATLTWDFVVPCSNCGEEFDPARTRWLCPSCGWHEPCCDGEPQ